MPRKTKLENCISRALYLIDTEPHTNLSPNRKRALYSDIHCLLEWAKDDLSPTGRWYTQPSSNLRGHHVYYDDIRGPDHSRYLITPIATKTGRFSRYDIRDETNTTIATGKTPDAAKYLAQRHRDKHSPKD